MSLGNSTEPYFCQLCHENIFPFQKVDNDTFHELFPDISTKAFFQTIDSQVNIRDISSSFYLTPTNMNEQYQAAKHFFYCILILEV